MKLNVLSPAFIWTPMHIRIIFAFGSDFVEFEFFLMMDCLSISRPLILDLQGRGRPNEQSRSISIAVCIYDNQCFTVLVVSHSVKGLGCEGQGILTAGVCLPKNSSRPLHTFSPIPGPLLPDPIPGPYPRTLIPGPFSPDPYPSPAARGLRQPPCVCADPTNRASAW